MNGVHLGTAFRRLSETVYPTIGLHSPGEIVIANFGQNVFRYDVQQLIAVSLFPNFQYVKFVLPNPNPRSLQQEKFNQEKEINEMSASVRTMHELVRKYLLHHGYGDTLHALDKTNKPEDGHERVLYDSLDNRKRKHDTNFESFFFSAPFFHETYCSYF